jgi:hypothetical protein
MLRSSQAILTKRRFGSGRVPAVRWSSSAAASLAAWSSRQTNAETRLGEASTAGQPSGVAGTGIDVFGAQ